MYNRLINPRPINAYQLRKKAAKTARHYPYRDHRNNAEEEDYRNLNAPFKGQLNYIGNFSKGLKHNKFGEVDPQAYRAMVRSMYNENPRLFERTDIMGTLNGLNLVNPQAGLAFDLEGADPQSVTLPPAPRIDSPQGSSEMGELYWMALLRDVSFADYNSNSLVQEAVDSLNNDFNDFRGPKHAGMVTKQTLFRGFTKGDLEGPYVSQFLLKPISYGTLSIEQLNKVADANVDYLTSFADWKRAQNGVADIDVNGLNDLAENSTSSGFQPATRYLCNLRDLTTYVHFDALYEAYLNACLILLNMPARLDPGNPYLDQPRYRTQRTQDGFATFGAPHILTLVTEVATRALKAVWFQKWSVHRRLRPEEFGGRIHVHLLVSPGRYQGMINQEILDCLQIGGLSAHFPGTANTFLLPQAFREGAPLHPAYGSGHATVAGACVTVLKAWFDESETFDPTVIPNVIPNVPAALITKMKANRQAVTTTNTCTLTNYNGRALTVGGELNKLAGNIAQARNAAGVHWRTDYSAALLLGEEIAIRLLQEQKLTYNEDHHLSLTKFDGSQIII